MNLRFVLLAFFLMTVSGFGETAYSALRVVGAKKGNDPLTRVLEVRGDGTREPAAWKIVLADPKARAGVREIEVRKGRITSDTTPARPRSASAPLDLSLVNLDSDGVVAVINQEMGESIPAERSTYTLSNGSERGTPVWKVELHHPRERKVTLLEIAADTGGVLAKSVRPIADEGQLLGDRDELRETDRNNRAIADDRAVSDSYERAEPQKQVRKKPTASRSSENIRDVPDLVESLVKRVEKRGRQLKRFLP